MVALRTGIIGVGGYGSLVLQELVRNGAFSLQAVADRDRELAGEYAKVHGAVAYDDYRSLIVEKKLDVVVLMVPPFLCGECLQLAAKAGVHVIKGSPLARTVPEATQWVQSVGQGGGVFHIEAGRRFSPGYVRAREWLGQNRIGAVELIEGELFYARQGAFDWRGDPILSGGGVLLESGSQLIDQVVWNVGLPEVVYCLQGNLCSKKVLPPYKTEDTAVVLMRYPDGMMARVSCGWMSGSGIERMVWRGVEGVIEAGPGSARLFDASGKLIESVEEPVSESDLIARQLRHFVETLGDEELKPVSLAKDRIGDVAVVETAYLSARTGLPEKLKVYGAMLKVQ